MDRECRSHIGTWRGGDGYTGLGPEHTAGEGAESKRYTVYWVIGGWVDGHPRTLLGQSSPDQDPVRFQLPHQQPRVFDPNRLVYSPASKFGQITFLGAKDKLWRQRYQGAIGYGFGIQPSRRCIRLFIGSSLLVQQYGRPVRFIWSQHDKRLRYSRWYPVGWTRITKWTTIDLVTPSVLIRRKSRPKSEYQCRILFSILVTIGRPFLDWLSNISTCTTIAWAFARITQRRRAVWTNYATPVWLSVWMPVVGSGSISNKPRLIAAKTRAILRSRAKSRRPFATSSTPTRVFVTWFPTATSKK